MSRIDDDDELAAGSDQDGLHPVRSGAAPWQRPALPMPTLRLDGGIACDVAIIGGGITGAMTAEALTRQGLAVLIVDRAFPGRGSTAASTAMLLWEIDTPLVELADVYGFDKAAAIYKRSLAAVTALGALVEDLAIDCRYRARPSLYLAAQGASGGRLKAEHAARRRAGLPGMVLDRTALWDGFAIDRPGAIVAAGAAEADPVLLANGLLRQAFARGARLVADEAVRYRSARDGAVVELASGASIEAGAIVLATGYDMPDFVRTDRHRILSTWCIATPPQEAARLWRDRALIWEDAEPYIYARFDADNRLLVGGEDEAIVDADERERRMPEKAARLVERMRAIQPQLAFEGVTGWTAAFGETEDGLPLIGAVPGMPHVMAAFGYGGNGITFSFMASRIIASTIAGETRPWFDDFALDR